MKEKYIPGKDCQCLAHNEYECGCDADWTPREVYELREQRDRLAEALREIKSELGVPQPEYPAPVANAFKIADEALSAVEGGSDDH
jgi:hypothetical protein